jgi:hypothetical protein
MTLTKIKELTVIEAIALAYTEYGHHRFTASSLTGYLCSILSDRFKVRSVQLIDELIKVALREGAFEPAPGPQGGPGYIVTEHGVELAAEVDLPRDKFERRAEAEVERRTAAGANAGPVFTNLLRVIPQDNFRDRTFIESLAQYWLAKGCLSSKQVSKIAEVATRHGQFIEERHYIGSALAEWTAPYFREQQRVRQEQLAVQQTQAAAEAAERKQREQAKKAIIVGNRKVKITLREMEATGGLAELDALVTAVFPNATLSSNAKATAFVGSGSLELRTCIAAVAFGQPPAAVWKTAGQRRQPDARSDQWQAVIAHQAYQAVRERHRQAGVDVAVATVEA